MSESVGGLRSKVDQIIDQRRRALPDVDDKIRVVDDRIQGIRRVLSLLKHLSQVEEDDASKAQIESAVRDLERLLASCESRVAALEVLKARFGRDSVNIGVSGEARVGKSTTLQKFAGLTDTQIPTGDGLPVTAVRSEIFNSPDEFAEITFRDQASFLSEYVKPLLDTINEKVAVPIVIGSLATLRTTQLPENLGNNVDSRASDSLKRLKEAQTSVGAYADLLTGGVERIPLADLRRFVAYPTNDDIRREDAGGEPAGRAYIAVRAVKIYCPFPQLDGVKVGLVDLPGLGEIGAGVADMHLHGLEDGVDQVFLIMRPTESEGFVKQGIASNIDHLRRIQPGIQRRGDLITAGINIYQGLDKTVQTLTDDFERRINEAQHSDPIDLREYTATDDASVAQLFAGLLEKIADRLPTMDREVFEHALAEHEDEADVAITLDRLDQTLTAILKRIPLPEEALNELIGSISHGLVDGYIRFEVELSQKAGDRSKWSADFEAEVRRIHDEVHASIGEGFFLGWADWVQGAKGQNDYYNYYRDEAKRLRREIIARYSALDVFYEDHVSSFKERVLEIFLANTGRLDERLGLTDEGPDGQIDRLRNELSGTVRDDGLDSAWDLLKGVQFSFRNNVFLQISQHLEGLANPSEFYGQGKTAESIRTKLGDVRDIDRKLEDLRRYLSAVADESNNSIREALIKNDDRFNEYLSVCSSFFIDFLYRKDWEHFKHVVVRRLVGAYRDYLQTGGPESLADQAKVDLIEGIKRSTREIRGGVDFGPTHFGLAPRATSAPRKRRPEAAMPVEPVAATDSEAGAGEFVSGVTFGG